VVSEATQPIGALEEGVAWPNERKPRSLRLGRHKLIVAPYLGREELYDLREDPGERRDLLREPGADALALRDDLRARLAVWEGSHALRAPEPAGGEAENAERLRALGYGDTPTSR
jgi:hypothetical protein